ncbi:MAG: hypothetical protein COU46_01430 [Candidatus Niyogibacteria bacterium CG10_big_fil_rev_8_21_14_0_10_42_19]|uniref:POTRA domain-containing protein n=1 Tax=Candidatus Niyogibacteria bacterium CG10_big_fil_rev_8_21_14_0_10_42_19 TaxID=1974725 RepID=A0A2H0THK4_9BACT|nr:MAG: hypothetical protein COU46_01430 [Candidatus Niyogibacteria bacterium CG10_big_fil_rev_8_21_14_0_10_42_19]
MPKDILTSSRYRLKKRRLIRKAVFILFGIIFLTILSTVFFSLNYFKISKPQISGNKTIDENIIRERINSYLSEKWYGLIPKSNIFIASTIEMTALLADEPKIKKMEIKKTLPRGLNISVTERTLWANVCSGNECFYAGDDGVIFERALKTSGSVFFNIEDQRDFNYDLGDRFLPEDETMRIIALIEKIKEKTGENFNYVKINSDGFINHYEIATDKRWKLIIDSLTDPVLASDNFVSSYDNFLKSEMEKIDYIDLRLENKVFYKNK